MRFSIPINIELRMHLKTRLVQINPHIMKQYEQYFYTGNIQIPTYHIYHLFYTLILHL